MDGLRLRLFAKVGMVLTGSIVAVMGNAQTAQQSGTLTIAGQPDQAALLRINGKSYVDIESLARIAHGTIRFNGTQTILTLPPLANAPTPSVQPSRPAELSGGFLSAEIEALAQIREWRAALVNAIQNNYPVIDFSKMTSFAVAGRRRHRCCARRQERVGYGFNSNGRYGQGGLIRERFARGCCEATRRRCWTTPATISIRTRSGH
jgi:hypothetical protein